MTLARTALELTARLNLIAIETATAWAHGFAIRLSPTHCLEHLISLRLTHRKHSLEADSAGCFGEKKVLHVIISVAYASYIVTYKHCCQL